MRSRISSIVLSVLFAVPDADAQTGVSPEVLTLARVTQHIASEMRDLPSYTCLIETIRNVREPKAKKFKRSDTVRLEVVLAGERELFAWPDDQNFADTAINELVQGGAIGSGSFGLFTKHLFLSKAVSFQPVKGTGAGRLAWSFRVPPFLSGYRLLAGGASGISGYEGQFEADESTHDLLTLHVRAVDIPAGVPYASSNLAVQYRKVPELRNASLPSTATLTLMDLAGREFRNDSTFTRCREFRAESTLLVEEVSSKLVSQHAEAVSAAASLPARAPAAPEPAAPAAPLPPGLIVKVKLETALDFASAAAGDRVWAIVTDDVPHGGSVVLPRGTQLDGRVHRFQRERPDSYQISIRFTAYELAGRRYPFVASLEAAGRKNLRIGDVGGGGPYAVRPPSLDYGTEPLSEWEKNHNTFSSAQAKLSRGFRMTWRTQTASH